MTVKKALITGITGQDGSYLTELLLEKGYQVHGTARQAPDVIRRRSDGQRAKPYLHHGDLTDGTRLVGLLEKVQPDEIYHLAACSNVRTSFDEPVFTGNTTGLGTIRLLEAIRTVGLPCRFYQASSSEMFGAAPPPQHEETPFHPRSPYGVAKVYAYWATRNYREAYGMYAVNGILFNHESPRRGPTFVTRKIATAAARIKAGLQDTLYLGNLDARRDWGYAAEYVEAMWLMLQQDRPDDYVIATGTSHSVRDFAEHCFAHVGLDHRDHIRFDERHLRPSEVDHVVGDASKAHRVLGWKAATHAPELARLMVDAELDDLNAVLCRAAGTAADSPLAN
ncbi:GDP-mannose 4,6-dehydratase [Streptomyces sp. NPDC007264]|uniref:GDP-mannose 4,6-dehydratase n=1 Tax=Streptomyces sp. NPDC007264 TaxID=3364777 RepID=UPI0036D871A1